MELKLVNRHTLETNSSLETRTNIREQVASSKGTEWMVKNYIAWQQRNPLASEPKRDSSSFMRLVGRMTPRETQVRSAVALSFRVLVFIVGLLLIGKIRW